MVAVKQRRVVWEMSKVRNGQGREVWFEASEGGEKGAVSRYVAVLLKEKTTTV